MPLSKGKILEMAKGMRGRAKNCNNIARMRVTKGLLHAYVGRKEKKRTQRSLWISKINAGSRLYGVAYGNLIHGMQQCNIALDRKSLAELAAYEPLSFRAVVEQVKYAAQIPTKSYLDFGHVASVTVPSYGRYADEENKEASST